VVSEGSGHRMRAPVTDFPADCPRHPTHFHLAVVRDSCGVSSKQPSFSLAVADEGRNSITTSPQSRAPPSTAPSKWLGHRLRVLPTFVV
jgi:hypothetical protein